MVRSTHIMTLPEVMKELAAKATPTTKRTHMKHGAPEPLFGVRIGDLKPLHKKLKGRQELAQELFATKNSDAMYLAGMIADGARMSPRELEAWAEGATWHMIAGCTVAWVAAEHPQGFEIARKWIDSKRELTAIAGWATLGALVSTVPDSGLPLKEVAVLLDRCAKTIHAAPNRARYAMNNFVICCGTYVEPLAEKAMSTARKMGQVEVDMGETSCEVPEAESYILKCRRGAPVAPKRKTVRC